MTDIRYLANTHSHGDHIGGHARLRQLGDFQVVSYTGSKPKVEKPVPYAIATRTKFPGYSPAPQSSLQGVKVDIAIYYINLDILYQCIPENWLEFVCKQLKNVCIVCALPKEKAPHQCCTEVVKQRQT